MRRFARGLLAIVPLLVLLQATATPVPRCLAVKLASYTAERCCHAAEHSCQAAERSCHAAERSCHADGRCCPLGRALPSGRSADSQDSPPVFCCMFCPFWMGLLATPPTLPEVLPAEPPLSPPGAILRSIDLAPVTPPPELLMSC